ncbi:hypothetical protein [Nonlabens agnitus]|uniref:Uncharacterized protein n=1 Tax=Nonlabens agnitus TaxID=870484 RepID=A0A2S9WSS0_9FLAO|nr:hypothetical protein [Nonlabens agnitus]PRP66527.1 hypothetical protein BST86_05155 [Nonlabens agnitus]
MMEDILTNWTFYAILVVMLFGAFIIGYFFGNSSNKTVVVKTEKVVVPLASSTPKPAEQDANEDKQDKKRIEIDELSRPGPIRALKTRERSGSLSNDAKMSLAEEKLDFESIGRGDRHNKDDFQKIIGIGPFIEEKLNSIGIYNFSQLANMSDKDMEAITALIDFFPGRIHRDDWKGQAKKLTEKENQA